MSGGVATIDRELIDYRQVASDLHVGVNHLALDEERIRQEQFFEGILNLQQRISKNPNYQEQYGEEIENLKNGIRLNADVLTYLKGITKLEGPLTDLTNKIIQAAVQASSSEAATPDVFANKALTENVNNCWEYIAQLSSIVQSHLKDAASYQQFHHMANEVDAHIDKMIGLAEMKMLLFDPQGTVDEAVFLAKELDDDHVELARAWEQTCQLTEMARHLKSVQNRLSRVVSGRTVDAPADTAQQVVMVKALINLSGPDFAIRKGEEMILMNNENPNFWRVKTSFGEREVPSLIFTTIGPNQTEVFRANSLQKKCVSDWKRILERAKGKLVKFYTILFERYCQNDAVYFAHEDEMNAFLDDIDSILIAPNYDSGNLHRACEKFTSTLMLLSPNRRPPRGAVALTESDIRTLHLPLRRTLSQAAYVDQIQARVFMTAEEVQRYLKSVEDERQHIFNEIAHMEQLQKEKENQLKNLADRMNNWKNKRNTLDRAISEYTAEPADDILKHFPSTRLTKLRMIENDYRSEGNHYETDIYEPSKASGNLSRSEVPSSDYGLVAKQMVTTRVRSRPSGIRFAGGVTQENNTGRIWAGNAMNLRRSASTNDLQTQILKITVNTSTQYDDYDQRYACAEMSGSEAAYNNKNIYNIEKNNKKGKFSNKSDVQAQIISVTKNASSQVGVRVMPKAIDLSRVDIGNLGLEVQNSRETAGLGLRVGEVLCPVTVANSVDLYEGPGVQVMGINDVESLSLELRDSVAHATADSQKRLKVRDVQAQIVTRSSSQATTLIRDDLNGDKRERETPASEVQTQIGILSRAAAVQAVAAMEVVNIPSHGSKKHVAEGATTSFCLLPDKEVRNMDYIKSGPSAVDVMTQISCLLHSRGIHSDLESYLSDYKKRNNINSETSDLCTQIYSVKRDHDGGIESANKKLLVSGFVEGKARSGKSCAIEMMTSQNFDHKSAPQSLKSSDVETLISKVMRDTSTQVSSRLVPTEVTVSKINMKNMNVSFTSPLRKMNIVTPVDSLICPADMKFRSELCEGSDFEIADYNGLSNILITHEGSVARGSIGLNEVAPSNRDLQTQITSGLKAQAAVVLRIDERESSQSKVAMREVIASSKYIPKLGLVIADIAGPSSHAQQNPTSDLQTQIHDTIQPEDVSDFSTDLVENAVDFTQRNSVIEGDWTTLREPRMRVKDGQVVTHMAERDVRVIGEMVCSKCHLKYRNIQMQFDSDMKDQRDKGYSVETQINSVFSDSGTQSKIERRTYEEYTDRQTKPHTVDDCMQVAVELIPTEISMSRYDIESMELEFEKENDHNSYHVKVKSVACPAKVRMQSRLVEGSGVHFANIGETDNIGFRIWSSSAKRTEENANFTISPDNYACDEFQSSVYLEYLRTTSLAQEKQDSSKSTQRSLVRLIPRGVEGSKIKTSDTVAQVFSIMADASTQVGTQLVPQAIGISPVRMENMEISVTGNGRVIGEETLSASTLLYPAQVELTNRLVNEQSGIKVVPLEQVEVMQMESSKVDALIHYRSPHISAQTQVETQPSEFERPNLLPASILMETGQFGGRRRSPELASQSLVCSILSNSKKYQELTIRPKSLPTTKLEFNDALSMPWLGYVANDAYTQTSIAETQQPEREISFSVQKTRSLTEEASVGIQVGTKLIPKALKVSQLPIKGLKLESTSVSSGEKRSLSFESLRYPAEITVEAELCEDSGIIICSLDQSGEIEVGMSTEPVNVSEAPRIASSDNSLNRRNLMSGWWTSVTSGKAPLSENKSTQNAAIKLPAEGVQATSSKSFSNESNIFLQAEAVLRSERGNYPIHDANPQLKLVVVETNVHNTSKPVTDIDARFLTPDRELPSVSSNMIDQGIQVGVKLIPNSIEIKPIRVENMEAVLTSKRTRLSQEIDVSAVLCASGIQYNEELSEASGVHVIQIDDGDDISLNYCGNRLASSLISNKKKIPVIESIDRNKPIGIHRNISNLSSRSIRSFGTHLEPNENDEYVTTLRIKNEQYLTGHSLSGGYWQGGTNLGGAANNVQGQIETLDKDIQVGLNLVPKTFTVDSMNVENLEMVNEQSERGVVEQVSVGAMLCTRPTQYDEILTESGGVSVLPIDTAKNIQIAYDGMAYYTTVDSERRHPQNGFYSSRLKDHAGAEARPRLRVRHAEFSADIDCKNSVGSCDNSRSKLRVNGTTQVGTVLIPTELKMEQMKLDTQGIPSLADSLRTENVLCPTHMSATSVLTECSGVQIASVKDISDISIQIGQDQFAAEVLRDSQSTQTYIAIREKSFSALNQPTSGIVSIIQPTQRSNSLSRMTSSSNYVVNSKAVQVGVLLIPTAVTMEKVKVDNLEIEVPLNSDRKAEVSVSAVLASSATEMTPVLTNSSGIQVIPIPKVGEIGIQVNGQSFIGTVDCSSLTKAAGTTDASRGLDESSINFTKGTKKVLLPISAPDKMYGTYTYTGSLLRQSTDLSQLQEALRSSKTTSCLREVNSTSVSPNSRPALLRVSQHPLVSVTDSTVPNSKLAVRKTQNSAVQVGLKLVPQTVEVCGLELSNMGTASTGESVLLHEEANIQALLSSSSVQYEQILEESTGVNVLPVKDAQCIKIEGANSKAFNSIDLSGKELQYGRNLEKIRTPLERISTSTSVKSGMIALDNSNVRLTQTEYLSNHRSSGSHSSMSVRAAMNTDATTQVGAIIVPQHLNLQKMTLETEDISLKQELNEGKFVSVLYPTNMEADIKLSDASGVQIANFDGDISVQYNKMEYNADVIRTSISSDASIRLVNKSVSLGFKRSELEVSLSKSFCDGRAYRVMEKQESYIGSVNKRLVSKSSQVGTLLVPTKVCMDKIDVEQLAVNVPLTEWKTTDLSVSAILASTATEMMQVITDTTGIQAVEIKDLDELGIQVGDDVYVASVVAPKSSILTGIYDHVGNLNAAAKVRNRKHEIILISVPKAHVATKMTQKAENLLSQSADLREIHSRLQSSSVQPRLSIKSTSGTATRITRRLDSQQSATQIPMESSTFTCECGRTYTSSNLTNRPITITCNSCGASGAVVVGSAGGVPLSNQVAETQESFHVTCEAAIKPTMFSKRLTANIRPLSIDVGTYFNAPVTGNRSEVMPETIVNQQAEFIPGAVTAREKSMVQVGIQCAIIHMDTLNVVASEGDEFVEGKFATESTQSRQSRQQFTSQQVDHMISKLDGASGISIERQTKRTHSAESRSHKKLQPVCVNCRSKILRTEPSVTEIQDPNAFEAAITIRRVSDEDLFETSQSITSTSRSALRRNFFSRDSGKRLSGSLESLRSHSIGTKCVVCLNELTSGDITTSVRTSTSSLLGSEAVVNMGIKEIADAYAGIYRATGELDGAVEYNEHASLYQTLRHNRIIQAVIKDYEKVKNEEEGLFSKEVREIVNVLATPDKQYGYVSPEPSTYSLLRNNELVKRIIGSYQTYKHDQSRDGCTQTDLAQTERDGFTSSDVQEIADVVSAFKRSQGQISSQRSLYTELKGNPIIQRVIKEFELDSNAQATTLTPGSMVEVEVISSRPQNTRILNLDGHLARMESEQFASTDSKTRGSFQIVKRMKNSNDKPFSSSVSSDSEVDDTRDWQSTLSGFESVVEPTRYDVACSALITPETWDKKVQIDLMSLR